MFRRQIAVFIVTAMSLLIFWGCGKKSPVLVHIGQNTVITLADYLTQNPGTVKHDSIEGDIQRMKTQLDYMVDNKIILLEAIKAGYAENPEVLAAVKVEEVSLLLKALYEHEIIDQYVKEADIRDYYIKSGKQVTLRKIYFAFPSNGDSVETERVRSEANEVLDQIHDGANFNFMASRYSHDSRTSMRGGLVGVRKYTLTNDPILNTAFSMKKGDVSDIIETPDGLTIIKIDDIEKIPQKPYSSERPRFKKLIAQNKTKIISNAGKTYLEDLKARSHIQLQKENIDSLVNIMKPWNTLIKDSVLSGLSRLPDSLRQMKLAVYDGDNVTVSDFQNWIFQNFGDRLRGGIKNPGAIESSLEFLIRNDLLTRVAKNKGLHRDKDIKNQLSRVRENAMIQQFIKQEILANIDPFNRELQSETKKQWLEEHRAKYDVITSDSEIKKYIESLYKDKT